MNTCLTRKSVVAVKTICLFLFFFMQSSVKAQKILFSDNFENKLLSAPWQTVTGNWHIAAAQELNIAPAEKENHYILSSGGPGIIRILVDIPDTIKARQVKLSFSYYTKTPGAKVETEFHKKDLKDGLKGKLWKTAFPGKATWVNFQKTLTIPVAANLLWVTFFETASQKNNSSETLSIDNVIVSSVR
jgi:hypothetical protein